MNATLKKILKWIGIVVGVLVAVVVVFFAVLTITEFKPDAVEKVTIKGSASNSVKAGDSLTVMSWNIGYAGLGENADFFMDGGSSVTSADKELVSENLQAILSEIQSVNPDIAMFQEVDVDSTRTHYCKELLYLQDNLSDYESSFANNFKTLWVPYPLPMIGKVDSGIATFSKLAQTSSERDALPCPFSYPVSLCNLKRCLMVNRIPVEGSDKELVIVNLHLEAYDSGEGKIKQTAQLRELLESEAAKGNYVIAGGDFNQTFSNVDASKYPTVSEEMWLPGVIDVSEFSSDLQFFMDENTASCRSLDKALKGADKSNFQFYIIDGFIVSGNVTIDKAEVKDLGFKNSDHNPLVMTVTLQ